MNDRQRAALLAPVAGDDLEQITARRVTVDIGGALLTTILAVDQ